MATFVWAAAANSSWNVGASWKVGGVAQGAPPTAADDVLFGSGTGATNSNCAMTANSLCRSLVMTGYTGTLNSTGSISIGDASGGICTLAGTIAGTWATTFKQTTDNAGAGWAITCNGKSFPDNVTFNGTGGKWTFADAFGTTNAIILTAGNLTTNAQTVTAQRVNASGSTARTLTITNSTLNLATGATAAWDCTTVTNLTFTGTGSTINMSNGNATFQGGGQTYGTVNFTNLSAAGFGGSLVGADTFVNLGVAQTGTAITNFGLAISSSITITGTLTVTGFTVQGNSRSMIRSSGLGTQITMTMTGGAVAITGDAIFRDINITGAPSWTNSGSSFVGDAGGNSSLITSNATAPTTQHWTNVNGGNWNVTANWTSRVPLPQDTAVMDAAFNASQTVTLNMLECSGDFTMAGATGTPTLSFAGAGTLDFYGSFTLIAGMVVSGTTGTLTMMGRSALMTLTSAGQSFTAPVTFTMLSPGLVTLQDAFSCPTDGALGLVQISAGAVDTNSQGFTVGSFAIANTANASITLGTTTVTMMRTDATTLWNVVGTNAVVSAASATFVVNGASANTRTFAGAGKSYGTLTYTVAGSTGQLTVTGSNTFGTINFSDVTNARTLTFTISVSITITGTLNVNGTSGKLMTINSTVGGTFFTMTKIGTLVSCDFLSVQDCHGAGVIPFYAGANSTLVSGTTNWVVSAPPVPLAPKATEALTAVRRAASR